MVELILYWLSKFLFPFRQSMPMGEKFRGFKGTWFYAFVAFALMHLHPCLFVLQGWLIHYINPLKKGLSSIMKRGEIESAWSPPCMVLVINDNLYGLMFALSYICRCVHLRCLISICWSQC